MALLQIAPLHIVVPENYQYPSPYCNFMENWWKHPNWNLHCHLSLVVTPSFVLHRVAPPKLPLSAIVCCHPLSFVVVDHPFFCKNHRIWYISLCDVQAFESPLSYSSTFLCPCFLLPPTATTSCPVCRLSPLSPTVVRCCQLLPFLDIVSVKSGF